MRSLDNHTVIQSLRDYRMDKLFKSCIPWQDVQTAAVQTVHPLTDCTHMTALQTQLPGILCRTSAIILVLPEDKLWLAIHARPAG